jgi:hypothetical protein
VGTVTDAPPIAVSQTEIMSCVGREKGSARLIADVDGDPR